MVNLNEIISIHIAFSLFLSNFSYVRRYPHEVSNCKTVNFLKPDFISDFSDSVPSTFLQSSDSSER